MTILHTQPTDKALAYETGRWDARGRVCVINRRREEMNKKPLEAKETQEMRKERVRNSPSLHTRVVESKKKYNRKKDKAQMHRSMED